MRRGAVILLSWWFLFYLSPDGRWTRFGPMEQPKCAETAANLVRAGLPARCVEFVF